MKTLTPISQTEIKELKRIGKLVDKRFKAFKEAEKEIALAMSPILKRLEANKDKGGLCLLLEHVPVCSTNGQFVYSAIYRLDNPKSTK